MWNQYTFIFDQLICNVWFFVSQDYLSGLTVIKYEKRILYNCILFFVNMRLKITKYGGAKPGVEVCNHSYSQPCIRCMIYHLHRLLSTINIWSFFCKHWACQPGSEYSLTVWPLPSHQLIIFNQVFIISYSREFT